MQADSECSSSNTAKAQDTRAQPFARSWPKVEHPGQMTVIWVLCAMQRKEEAWQSPTQERGLLAELCGPLLAQAEELVIVTAASAASAPSSVESKPWHEQQVQRLAHVQHYMRPQSHHWCYFAAFTPCARRQECGSAHQALLTSAGTASCTRSACRRPVLYQV